jgi:hypothetical protein
MRLARVRFTLRRMMAAVAVVAVMLASWLGALELRRLSTAYLQKSVGHSGQERIERRNLEWQVKALSSTARGGNLNSIVLAEAVTEHHRSWAARYLRASRRPWESVPPEPPPPTWETHKRVLAPVVVARAIAIEVKGLSLPDAGVTDDLLDRIGRCHQLRSIDLSGNPITDAGLVHLKRLTNLERLVLAETRITDAGLIHLAALSGLQKLDLYRTRITRSGLRDLGNSLPRTMMFHDPGFIPNGGTTRSKESTASHELRLSVEFPPPRVLKPGEPVGATEVRARVK